MADWVDIQDSQIDPDAPLTSELAYSWRDNPIAIAEGAVDAPKVMGQALKTMVLWNASGQTIVTDLGRAGKLMLWFDFDWVAVTPATNALIVDRSINGGSTWGNSVTLAQVTLNPDSTYSRTRPINNNVFILNLLPNFNAVRFRATAAPGQGTLSLSMSAFVIDGVQP